MTVHITERLAMSARFRAVLRAAMSERDQRPDEIVLDDETREFEWVLFERRKMFAEVNSARAERALPSVEMTSVARVEQMACGHIDYFEKFALYCAELALGVTEPRP
jgi:hypothetical protein